VGLCPQTQGFDIVFLLGIIRIFNYKYLFRQMTMIADFWQNVEGYFGESAVNFYRAIVDRAPATGKSLFVEVGCFKGRSSAAMATMIANSGKSIDFHCVDTWMGSPEQQRGQCAEDLDCIEGRCYDVFTENMQRVKDYYRAYRMTSLEASRLHEDGTVDFVFIDADHGYEAVKTDIVSWLPKLREGAIMAGHDYGHPPVTRAVSEQFGELAQTDCGCWYGELRGGTLVRINILC